MKNLKSMIWLPVLLLTGLAVEAHTPVKPPRKPLLLTLSRTLGEGFLYANLSSDHDIPLFRTEFDSVPFDTLRIRHAKDRPRTFTTHTLDDRLAPFSMYCGDSDQEAFTNQCYGLESVAPKLIFRVLKHSGDHWLIVIGEDSKRPVFEVAFIKCPPEEIATGCFFQGLSWSKIEDGKVWGFESWKDRFTSEWGVCSVQDSTALAIRDKPNGKVVQKISGCVHNLIVRRVDGEWLYIRAELPEKNLSGWVRWRNGDTLLIDVYTMLMH